MKQAEAEVLRVDRGQAEFAYRPDAPPRARLRSGDTVLVETRDPRSGALSAGSSGTWRDLPAGSCPNALTGPLAVAGARPGDVLAAHILDLVVQGPGYMAYQDEGWVLPVGRLGGRGCGVVDVHGGQVRWRAGQHWPCRPMCGCIGVAHPEAPGADATGTFGGNMDHACVRRGCTVYLPVFADEALLYVGDLHASMGDGELSGAGVEVPGELTLHLDLVRGQRLPAPRLQTRTRIITLGWGREFPAARRMAIEDMLAGDGGVPRNGCRRGSDAHLRRGGPPFGPGQPRRRYDCAPGDAAPPRAAGASGAYISYGLSFSEARMKAAPWASATNRLTGAEVNGRHASQPLAARPRRPGSVVARIRAGVTVSSNGMPYPATVRLRRPALPAVKPAAAASLTVGAARARAGICSGRTQRRSSATGAAAGTW